MSFSDLPSLSNLIQRDGCKRFASETTCNEISKNEELQSDPRLKNWQEWMKKRKKMHLKLTNLLNREAGDLLMNNAEEIRLIKEQKAAFDYAKLLQDQKREVPTIENIGVPEKIMTEKDVMPRARNSYTTWKESASFKKKCEEFKVELNIIQMHNPDFNELHIRGRGFMKTADNQQQQPIKKQDDNLQKQFTFNVKKKLNLSLAVNDFILTANSTQCDTRKVYIMFDYDVSTDKVHTKHLVLKNLGNATIQYYWKASEIVQYFKDIILEKEQNTVFYFNKNEGSVIPGEMRQIPIWFKINKPGVYIEHWEFCTRPSIIPENCKLTIVLHASAVIGNLDETKEKLKEELNNSMKNRLIKDSLASVLSNIQYNKHKPIIYSYNKKEVFEAISGKYDPIHLQPKYQYKKEVIRELQKFYKTVRRKTDPKSWNYNIHELRILTNAKQRSNEEEMQRYKSALSRQISLKGKKVQSMDIPKTVFPVIATHNQSHHGKTQQHEELQVSTKCESHLNEDLENIIAKLKSSPNEQNLKVTIYTQAYVIISTCFTKIENDIERLRQKMNIVKHTVYPKLQRHNPARFHNHYENLSPVFLKPPLTENITNNKHKPANETIQELPLEDCQARFNAYHNTTAQTSAIPSKGKNGANKPPDKTKPLIQKQDDSDEDGYPIDEHFDPYANNDMAINVEQYHSKAIDEVGDENLSETMNVSPPAILCQFNFNLYVIIYKHMSEAVENIADLLELRSFKEISHLVIKEIEQPNYTKRLIDLKNLLAQEDLDNVKAKITLHNYRKTSKLDWEKIEMERQLKHAKSDSSLWSVLQSYKPKIVKYKPISYPIDIYEADIPKKRKGTITQITETTSTMDAKVDSLLPDYQNVVTQKRYEKQDEEDDLVACIEKIKSETSAHSLYDYKFSKETQKNIDDHISDKEFYYYSPSNSELSNSSIDSEQNDDSCCSSTGVKPNTCDCDD